VVEEVGWEEIEVLGCSEVGVRGLEKVVRGRED